jgi:hypothetical protein
MKQKSLSLDEHRELAKHLYAINGHISAILKIVDGRVPVAILDQLLSGKPLDMKIFKLRDGLRNHMYKQHGPLLDTGENYFSIIDAKCCTSITHNREKDPLGVGIWGQEGTNTQTKGEAQ